MNALEDLRRRLTEQYPDRQPVRQTIALAPPEVEAFFARVGLPAFEQIASELEPYFKVKIRRFKHTLHLVVLEAGAIFNYRLRIENKPAKITLLGSYHRKPMFRIPSWNIIDEQIDLREYETVTAQKIVEVFAPPFLHRRQLLADYLLQCKKDDLESERMRSEHQEWIDEQFALQRERERAATLRLRLENDALEERLRAAIDPSPDYNG